MQQQGERVDDKPEGRTDWDRLRKMTDAEIAQAVVHDPDAAPILSDEEMRREYKPESAIKR